MLTLILQDEKGFTLQRWKLNRLRWDKIIKEIELAWDDWMQSKVDEEWKDE
jgi:hypothetical protein